MERNDPLIETSINILKNLRVFNERISKLDHKIAEEEDDKKILEQNIDMLK